MLDAIQRYVHKRRHGFIKSATFLYGSYALSTYISERLDEMKDKMLRNKLARDSLRKRFQSTHDDVCFTIMTLMPTLASQILEDMDVEALTNELQSISRASRSRTQLTTQNPQLSQSVSELSSVSDANSDAGSASFSSYAGSTSDGDHASAASGSWIVHSSVQEGPTARPDVSAQLSDSITSASSSSSRNGHNMEDSITSTSPRSRAQLWNEVKILALTRTLTTLYTTTLLSLLTAVQLNLLGRSSYIDSVRASDRAECENEEVPHLSLTGILAREALASFVDVEAIWSACGFGDTKDGNEEDDKVDTIPEETELRFLTLSWWVLHVGWKDVAARIRSSVECVFDDVSLKTKLSPSELFKLIMDVRRRVESDSTGSKMSERFLSSLLPPTPEITAHVLAQGGALRIPQERDVSDSIDRLRMKSPPPICDSNRPLATCGNVESSAHSMETSHNGLTRATAIPIESPVPHHADLPTPPSSHANESDLSSCTSQSPENSSTAPRLQPAQSAGMSDSLAMLHSGLDTDPQFTTLLAESQRYLSGPDFDYALGCALDRATEVLMDGLRARVFVDTASAVNPLRAEEAQAHPRTGEPDAGASPEKDEVKIRLAGLLPGLARWCQLALNATPNELVDNIMAVREVTALEAIIISDYEDRFPAVS